MYDVTALGELLIDFTPSGTSEAGMRIFEQNPGGAPANALAVLAKLGKKTAFIGKVGDDMHGAFLKETLEKAGIDATGLVVDPEVFTTLAFVSLNAQGERQFSFARKPGADTCLRSEEVNLEILKDSRIFHVGSLSLTGSDYFCRETGAGSWQDCFLRPQLQTPFVEVQRVCHGGYAGSAALCECDEAL